MQASQLWYRGLAPSPVSSQHCAQVQPLPELQLSPEVELIVNPELGTTALLRTACPAIVHGLLWTMTGRSSILDMIVVDAAASGPPGVSIMMHTCMSPRLSNYLRSNTCCAVMQRLYPVLPPEHDARFADR